MPFVLLAWQALLGLRLACCTDWVFLDGWMDDCGMQAPQLIQAANALMQHNAYPNEQELSRALNDAIGGSNDEQCIRLAGGFTMWKSLRSQVWWRRAPIA